MKKQIFAVAVTLVFAGHASSATRFGVLEDQQQVLTGQPAPKVVLAEPIAMPVASVSAKAVEPLVLADILEPAESIVDTQEAPQEEKPKPKPKRKPKKRVVTAALPDCKPAPTK